ncbi:MAG: hypothetical protein Q9227_002875 [Pyrenula ochraceoflavens]
MPTGGAPGLPNLQNRQASSGVSSFAQSVNVSQPSTPFDQSDFPSLSGNNPSSQQNPGQAVWPPRQGQQNPGQRQQLPHQQPGQRNQSSEQHDDLYNDFRPAQGLGGGQQQSGSQDDFPALRDNTLPERRGSLIQGNAFDNYGMGFGGIGQRNPLANPMAGQENNRLTSPLTAAPNTRSPLPQAQNGTIGQGIGPIGSNIGRPPMHSLQTDSQPRDTQRSPSGEHGPSNPIEPTPYTQLSDEERRGIPGLIAKFTGRIYPNEKSPDIAHIMHGQDLTKLAHDMGFDPNTNERWIDSWAGPFVPLHSLAPTPQSDFQIPSCYNVANVQPLHERIPSFSEDSLFYIFYTMPRDIMQELAAEELTKRKWRYHKYEKMWMTKDESSPQPVPIDEESEQGMYIWWDWKNWRKARRQVVLRFSDLEDRGIGGNGGTRTLAGRYLGTGNGGLGMGMGVSVEGM